jgi:hypothetical protein
MSPADADGNWRPANPNRLGRQCEGTGLSAGPLQSAVAEDQVAEQVSVGAALVPL